MNLKKLEMLDFYKISIIRNAMQYSLGAGLYFTLNSSFSLLTFIIGLVGFLIAYQSVYFFNDIMDYESDKKDEVKSKTKLLTKGKMTINTAISMAFILATVGLLISFSLGEFFGVMVFLCLFLNFLHSSNMLRLKTTKLLLPNLFVIEFIKYSLGWFVFSSNINNFPFLLIAMASVAYITSYVYYKNNARNFFKDRKINILTVISISLYLMSIFVYPFKLPLILLLMLSISMLSLRKINNYSIKINASNLIFFLIIASFILSIISLAVPSVAQINKNISVSIDSIKANISNDMPENLKIGIKLINKTISESISEGHNFSSLLRGSDIFDLR